MSDRSLILCTAIGDDASDPEAAARAIEAAEAATIDLMLVGGGGTPAFDPLVVAAWLAPQATSVGLVPMIAADRSEPFHVARALSALDFLTGGRSGWQPVGGGTNRTPRAADFVAATQSLWDSWDADALIIDQQSGLYLDSSKVRRNDHRGPFFNVLGPLNAARPPQGYPVLVLSDADALRHTIAPDVLIADWDRADCPPGPRIVRLFDAKTTISEIEHRFRSRDLDGLMLADTMLPAFVRDTLPALQRGGLVRTAGKTGTLRSRLQLPVPANPLSAGTTAR